MPEKFRDLLGENGGNIDSQIPPLENPEVVPEVSEKFRNMRCFETFQDDDHIWKGDCVMSQDFITILYKAGDGKTLKTYNRESGRINSTKIEGDRKMFMDVEMLKDGKSFATVVGSNLEVRDIKTLKVKGSFKVNAAFGNKYDQTPDFRKIVFNGSGSDLVVIDLETGKENIVSNKYFHLPSDALICLGDAKTAAVGFDNKIQLLDIEENLYKKTLSGHETNVSALAESRDGKQMISGSVSGEIKIWDKNSLSIVQEFRVNQPVKQIKEARDHKHLIVSGGGSIRVVNKETGEVIRGIEGDYFFESPNGTISIVRDEKVELWSWGIDQDATPNEVVVRGDKKISNKERFNDFSEKRGETVKGVHWYFYENLEAQRLSENRRIKWGNERIYFEVPLDELPELKKLVMQAVKEAQIGVTFKYLDVESSSPEMVEKDVTRFVVNFVSVEDARKFYEILQGDSEYVAIQPDRSTEYLAHNIDGKAFYAQGFREIREYDKNQILDYLKSYTQNPDGSYSAPSSEGGVITISKEEYERLASGADIIGSMKKSWEGETKQKS